MKNINSGTGKKTVLLTVSKVITMLLSMVTAMILSRSLSRSEYGTYSELLTITSLFVSIFSVGLPSSLNYFLPQCNDTKEKRNFLSFYYTLISVISIFIAVMMLILKNYFAAYYKNPQLLLFALFLSVIPWTKILISSRNNMLVAEGNLMREFIYTVANACCLVILALTTWFVNVNFYLFTVLYVIVETFFSIIVYCETLRITEKKISINISKQQIISLLKYSLPLGLSTAISTISLDLDKLIIGFFETEESVAIYANAGKELPFSIIATSFTAIILPQIIYLVKKNDINKALAKWKAATEICFIILLFCSTASVIFAPQIISLLYSAEYLSGVGIFRIYSITLLFRVTYWGMILNAYGKTTKILINSLICIIINVILSIGMYLWVGFVGPAIATVISIGIMSLLQIMQTSRMIKKNIFSILPFKNFGLSLIAAISTAIVIFFITKIVPLTTDWKGILIAVAFGILWALMYFTIMFKRLKTLWYEMKKNDD